MTREQLAIIYDIEVSQNLVKNRLSWEEIRDFLSLGSLVIAAFHVQR